jgi:hypothetical protein
MASGQDPDLERLTQAWIHLPEHFTKAILALVDAADHAP